ncbi:ATP-binding protein [Streptomyces sp. H39-S7]|uniref:ATP-binding protein n=1 Tax=Streptomyces sp. H39-S7 TaxID=3004357 RepID=UPI0022AFFF35|nr:ATP-binding protein [Streptomyces sp. H39-S7]MCZ4119875.1 ATP-binding protein [Streptomyces sp. H39-S7]
MTQDPPEPSAAPVAVGVLYRADHYGVERSGAGDARRLAELFVQELAGVLAMPASERFVYDVLLVVTELLTNANRYAPGPCLMELDGGPSGVTVTVWDSSTALPRAFPHDPTRIGGHGLEIVRRICTYVTAERVPVGKRIRALIPLPTGP